MLYVIAILLLILVLAIPAARSILIGLLGGSLVLAIIGVVLAGIVLLGFWVFSFPQGYAWVIVFGLFFGLMWIDSYWMDRKIKAENQRDSGEE